MINSRWIFPLLVALVCMAVPAMAQPTPFVISGDIFDADGNPCNGAWVQITNLNTTMNWDAENSSTSNYYELELDSDDVNVDDIIRIEASGCSPPKTVEHTVTQDDIDEGGFSQDIMFESDEEPDLIVTEKSEEWISLEDRTYNVTYTVANTGTSDADASTTSIEIDETVVETDSVPALAIDVSYTSTLGPFTLSGENDTIIVCADSDETISELDESNNCLSNVLEESGLPDLTITEKSEEWITLEDRTYNVTYTVANIGTSDADACNTTIEIDGTMVATDSVPALAIDESYTSTIGPFTLSDDNDTIRVCADSDGTISELDETNNCLSNVLEESGLPDLSVTEKSEEWISLADLTYNVTYTVANIGTSYADESTTSIEIDGPVVATDTVPALAIGENYTNTLGPFTLSDDNDTIRVCADSDGTISELDETNNCLSNVLEESGLPDLSITEKSEEWISIEDSTYNITYTVANTGTSDADASTTSIEIDETVVTTDSVPALAIGENYTNTLGPFTLSDDNDTIKVCADSDETISELDETNNCLSNVLEGSGLPDLSVTEKSEEWISLEDGTYNVTYTVANIGTSDADASTTSIEIDETVVETDSVPALVIGDNYTNTLGPFTLSGDNDTIKVCADSDETISELDETNNCLSNVLEESGLPDLSITEKSEEWISIEDSTYNITYTVANTGTSDADASTTSIEIDETVVTTDSVPALAIGENYTNTLGPFTLSDDNDTIKVCADSDETISELDETNNCLSNVLEGSGLPDLSVTEKSEEWISLEDGTYNVTYTVANIGTSDADASTTSIEIDETVVETDSVPALVIGDNYTNTLGPFTLSGDNDTIKVCADSDETISELDETNNCLSNVLEGSGLPDLSVTGINSYHNSTDCPAWFNLSNEIDVTVKNTGNAPVGASSVSLYIEDVFFGKLPVPSMAAGAREIVTFTDWMPVGEDCLQEPCVFEWSIQDYNFTGVADCDNDVDESDEGNNETTVVDNACYNGYMADEPLENVAHGMLNGAVLFTTGDGTYGGLNSPGVTRTTNYDITIPDNANVELAKLNVYYTWTSPDHACPEMEVQITNATGTYVVPLEKAYDDIKCTCGGYYIKTWGNYVFDLTDYITGTSTYTVTVENVGSSGHSFCVSAPGIALVYEDENAPLIEYWINEGADVLMGGRRYETSSNLAWWENINNATFSVSTQTGEVVNATLGVVSPWGGSSWDPGMTNYLFFNDIKLGTGVYHGYDNAYSETIDGITMHVGSTSAQVGVNVTSVTDLYLKGSDNVVGQCDDGDNMMPCNAFFVVEYESSTQPDYIEIGDGTDTEYYVPFHGGYDYGWSKIIYTKSEIGAPITINKIALNVSKPAGYSYTVNDQKIYMGYITNTSFDGDESKPDPSTLTEVYNGGITWESGWTIITLDTSFPYNNVDNLLIYYENRDGSWESEQPIWCRTLTLPDYRSVYKYADGSFPTDDGNQARLIPNIQLHYSEVATGIAVSKTVYDPDAGEWVDSISGAIPGETYRFRIDATATGCDLTDVVVNDTLSPGLGYAGNPSPSDPVVIGDVYQWTFPTLNDSETRTIEFDATVDHRGLDCNLASVTGWCNEPGPEQYSDEATACIDSRVDLAVKSDWNEHIKVNPACNSLDFYRIIVNESNTIRVWIINNGPGNITSGEEFDVCFDINGVEIACVTLQGPLNASEDRYYDIEWTPDCTPRLEWPGYPPMPGYPSTELSGYTLNVTVDCPDCPSCPPGGAINETDEDNNRGYRVVNICNNGYKSKNIDCGPSDPLTSFGSSEMYGGVVYNVSGRKNYPFETGETDTRIHNIEIPAGMTVVEARLYVYWYDYFYNPVPGRMADLGVNFNGTTFTMPDASYNDQKGFGMYNTPKGTYAYNVTSLVTGSGNYTVVVENIDQANSTTLLGEMLLVVYEDPTQDPNNRIQLWIMEGCDLLKGDAGYCVSPDEATASAAFGGSIDLANVDTASLISVVSQGMEDGNNLLFNGNITRTDAWNASSEAGPMSGDIDGSRINVEVVDVTDNLTSSGNTLGFQDTGTMGFQASNAIFVVEYDGGVSPRPDLIVTEKYETLDGSVFTVTYTVENNGDSNAGASNTSIYVDGTQVATDPVGALAVGATHEGTVVIDHFDCPCDTDVTVTVCADNEDVVDESDEANNCLNNTFSCPPCLRSDLVIIEKSEEWIDQVNKIYSITYTVANNGDAAAGASTTSITIDGTEVATDLVAGLAVSESHTATLGPFTMSGDDDTINVCADIDNVVDEIDETNNCLENTFTVEGTQSYGESVYSQTNVVFEWDALDEPDDVGAVLFRNAKIAIELEETVPACNEVSVRVVRLGFRSVNFDVEVSSDGSKWNTIGSETINSWMTWEDYDFSGDFDDVKYIRITKPGTRWKPRLMGLDAVYAED